ncbi:MAG: EMC3/TMCO1 family protein [Candidatus Hodarchaeota archaeon]
MSNIIVIIQIMFITLGMIILGMILNYILGLKKEVLIDLRKKALNLQERMKNAQLIGDYQLMAQLQRESVQFMKLMTKKQLVPMCLRCLIFIGIFAILGFIYSDYNTGLLPFPLLIFGSGWIAIYLIFSLYFSLVIFGIKRLTGIGTRTQSSLREIMAIISPTQRITESPFQISTDSQYQSNDYGDKVAETRKDSWKDRIEE